MPQVHVFAVILPTLLLSEDRRSHWNAHGWCCWQFCYTNVWLHEADHSQSDDTLCACIQVQCATNRDQLGMPWPQEWTSALSINWSIYVNVFCWRRPMPSLKLMSYLLKQFVTVYTRIIIPSMHVTILKARLWQLFKTSQANYTWGSFNLAACSDWNRVAFSLRQVGSACQDKSQELQIKKLEIIQQ